MTEHRCFEWWERPWVKHQEFPPLDRLFSNTPFTYHVLMLSEMFGKRTAGMLIFAMFARKLSWAFHDMLREVWCCQLFSPPLVWYWQMKGTRDFPGYRGQPQQLNESMMGGAAVMAAASMATTVVGPSALTVLQRWGLAHKLSSRRWKKEVTEINLPRKTIDFMSMNSQTSCSQAVELWASSTVQHRQWNCQCVLFLSFPCKL